MSDIRRLIAALIASGQLAGNIMNPRDLPGQLSDAWEKERAEQIQRQLEALRQAQAMEERSGSQDPGS
jgi:hypothetical protein